MPCKKKGLNKALLCLRLAAWQGGTDDMGNCAAMAVTLSGITWKAVFDDVYFWPKKVALGFKMC